MEALVEIGKQTLQITGFVFAAMLVIEYVNVLTGGAWRAGLTGRRFVQYALAAALGAVPGCLGAFAVVAMYSHRLLTVGALMAAMVATSGDEAFILLALVPRQALALTAILIGTGLAAGWATDAVLKGRMTGGLLCEEGFDLHLEERCDCFPRGKILRQWRECSATRGLLAAFLVIFILGLLTGGIGEGDRWSWINTTLFLAAFAALFIVSTVPDHFLEEHLWKHVARAHLPAILLWTLGALILMRVLINYLEIEAAAGSGRWILLVVACLVGLIPQSGPHLVFVTLFAQGVLPFGVLLANSIVQDGHGMLPLLAHSRRAFIGIKAVKFALAAAAGAILLALKP